MKKNSFEASLAELEEIVGKLETGDLTLEDSLAFFERGVQLSRECQKRLDEAERKVEILVKGAGGEITAAPYETDEE